MSRVTFIEENFDSILFEKGLRRTFYVDTTEDGLPYYREKIIEVQSYTEDVKPWWKKKIKK